jgi:hypothetical protein
MRDDADPAYEIGAQLKRFILAPQDDAHFLKNLFGVGRVAEERYEIGEKPAVVLGKQTREGITPLAIREIRIATILQHENPPGERETLQPEPKPPLLVPELPISVSKNAQFRRFRDPATLER